MENLKLELKRYILENYAPEKPQKLEKKFAAKVCYCLVPDFMEMYAESKGETFSEMLLRLIAESGETFSAVYNHAGINRQHFYKIRHNDNYKPSKQTAVSFAFSLKLDLEKTQALLKTAGYTLTKNNLGDVIEMFFIESQIFDFDTVNQYLDEYSQPLLGDWKCNLPGDQIDKNPRYNPPRNSEGGSTLKNVTEIVFILDRSGSMAGLEADTIGGFNSTLNQNKDSEGDAIVSTVLFNQMSEVIHDRVPIAEIPPLTAKEYFVGGSTALLDAVGDAIRHIRNVHKYAREEDRPAKTLFVITTDGEENSSMRYSFDDIKKLIEKQKEAGWEFLFLGANIDSVEVSGRMGIDSRRTVNYHNDQQGSNAKFRSTAMFMRMARSSSRIADVADEWREEVDRDFVSRDPNKK